MRAAIMGHALRGYRQRVTRARERPPGYGRGRYRRHQRVRRWSDGDSTGVGPGIARRPPCTWPAARLLRG